MTGPAPSVTVRPATLDDVDAAVAVLAEVAGEGRWIGTEAPVDVEQRRRRMVEDVEREEAIVLVAEAGGQVVGELGLYLARYGVADLGMAVAAGWRGRGIGSALLAEAIDRAGKAGAHKIALQVWPHNSAAIALYERFGFEREGYLRRHYRRRSGELWDAVIMGLPLDSPGQPA
ncbi:MAG TPA: GNAT family N-acetyltransferase [Actinomycetes bacterium]|nr:GNAT family N-acetyltransferase [Actinomycetes bacterium]